MLTLVQKVRDSRPKSKLLIPDPGRSSLHFPAFSGTLSLELACSPPVGVGEGMTGGGGACAALLLCTAASLWNGLRRPLSLRKDFFSVRSQLSQTISKQLPTKMTIATIDTSDTFNTNDTATQKDRSFHQLSGTPNGRWKGYWFWLNQFIRYRGCDRIREESQEHVRQK